MSAIRRWLAALELGRLLRVSAALTLLALGLMVWSMVQPTPLPVMLAMTAGQALGTLAFALYGYVVIADLRRSRRARREAAPAAAAPEAAAPEGEG
jgi:hypothetical protein